MAKQNHPDYYLLSAIIILAVWGLFSLATVSFPFSLQKYGSSWDYFIRQLLVGFLPGVLIGLICFKLNLEKLKKISVWLFLGNALLALLVFVPGIGLEINGA